jgi:hypothetical protein
MTLYPEVQRRAQAEMDQNVGHSRLPDFSDEGALPYVEAVLKEVLRWHPVTPLGVFLLYLHTSSRVTVTRLLFQLSHTRSWRVTPTRGTTFLQVRRSYRTRGTPLLS